jgi:hypothetical protein
MSLIGETRPLRIGGGFFLWGIRFPVLPLGLGAALC